MDNRVARLMGRSLIEMGLTDIPVPEADEVLIKVKHAGICGSDVHNYREGRTGKRVIKYPFVLGHEFAGEIIMTGARVVSLAVGDRVCVEPGVGCGECCFCKSGRYNLCERIKFMSAYPNEGCMQDYVTFPAKNCFKLPDNLTTIEGALIEPLAVGLHSASRGGVKCGDAVVILGAGCIGLMTLLACKARNAATIIAVDIFDNRLQKALELGATAAVNSADGDAAAKIAGILGKKRADVVFETAGQPVTTLLAAEIVGRGGTIVTVGNVSEPTPYKFVDINMKEVQMIGVFRYSNVFPLALELISSGKIDLNAVKPDIFPFEETQKAFQYAINNGKDVIKCVLEMD